MKGLHLTNDRNSIFRQFYSPEPFVDRFLLDPDKAVDVIVPLIHTNELWEKNLISFYREIPVNRLLISDGGCIDDSIEIAKKFPRVQVLDHRHFKSLGYCIRGLIEAVETEWFIYPHSDVYLPPGWFDVMSKYKPQYDWFGCPMRHVVIVEYDQGPSHRPYAGSQMGRKAAFVSQLAAVEDDYVYRQEDYIFERIVQDGGFKTGKVEDMFHYHQTMHKVSKWGRRVKGVSLDMEINPDEHLRTADTQVRGIVKYLHPDHTLAKTAMVSLARLIAGGHTDLKTFMAWVKETDPTWIPYLQTWKITLLVLLQKKIFKNIISRVVSLS